MSRFYMKEVRSLVLPGVATAVLGAAVALTKLGFGPFGTVSTETLPLAAPTSVTSFALYAALTGVLIGLWQTITEAAADTWLLLWHRPFSRGHLLATKAAAGLTVTLLAAAVPLSLTVVVAATGHTLYPVPFRWAFVWPAAVATGAGCLTYVGALASGYASTQWWGTRLWPAAATSLVATATTALALVHWPMALLLTAVVAGGGWAAVRWQVHATDVPC